MKVTYGMFARLNGKLVYVNRIEDETMAIVTYCDYPHWYKRVPLCKLRTA